MCMATFIPANSPVPTEGLRNGSIINDDGHGWAVASAEYGLEIGKSMKFDEALAGLLDARRRHGPGSLALFHSRIATHGMVNEYNVHPFWVGDDEDTVVAHNGILPKHWHPVDKDDNRSDTRILAATTLPLFQTKSGIPSRRGARRLGEMIGSGNKLVILSVKSGTPKVRIINAYMGEQSDGCWFSNTGFEERKYRSWSGGRGYWWDDGYVPGFFNKATNEWHPGYYLVDGKKTTLDGSPYPTRFDEDAWPVLGNCEVCLGEDCVDLDTMWCNVCDSCSDCFNKWNQCTCIWADQKRRENDATVEEVEVNEILGAPEGDEENKSLVAWPMVEPTLGDYERLGLGE